MDGNLYKEGTLKKWDHVRYTPSPGTASKHTEGFLKEVKVDKTTKWIDKVIIQFKDSRETEEILGALEVAYMIQKPVTGCTCYSCRHAHGRVPGCECNNCNADWEGAYAVA